MSSSPVVAFSESPRDGTLCRGDSLNATTGELDMLGYYFQLAFGSFRRSPGLVILMVLAVAVGIGVCVVTLTFNHAMSGNPIWWKSDQLYAVTLDNWDPMEPADPT